MSYCVEKVMVIKNTIKNNPSRLFEVYRGALDLLLDLRTYAMQQNAMQQNANLENEITLIDQNITELLKTVTPELVQKYFPDFYIQ